MLFVTTMRRLREMVAIMVEGEPGEMPRGKPVYENFDKNVHIAKAPLVGRGNG